MSQIGDWVREIRDNHWKLTYQLKPRAVRVTGDVATALYAAEYVTDYGDGMCAAQEPLKTPRE